MENEKVTEQFYRLEKMFYAGYLEEKDYSEITENGIVYHGEYIYRRGETLEDYLERMGVPKSWKYPYHVGDIVDYKQWIYKDMISSNTGDVPYPQDWHAYLDTYIDELDDDTVLVSLDYHI